MSFTVEQKSQLAKLMATENLRVEHQKIRTAKFDPKNRVLYLPVWQNMSGFLYDLLTGHEVGHALYTPAEGWHDAVVDKSKGKNYKHFLNVVEDARIEKKVKRRYPGLRLPFQKAYEDLHQRDFFGIKNRDINSMPFIDRLNIFTKSQYTSTFIKFNNEETVFVEKIQTLETWDDVLKLTDEIYEYSKNEQYEIENEHYSFDEYNSDDNFDDYEFDDYDGEDEGEDSDSTENLNGESGSETVDDENQEEKTGNEIKRKKDSVESKRDNFEPVCETDENFRENESSLLDETCKDYIYLNVPQVYLENVITPAKRVHELLSKFYNEGGTIKGRWGSEIPFDGVKREDVTHWVNEFKRNNERYISLLAKEFEMRKAAKSFSKSKLSDTGDIDISKLASYRFDDNIFRKVMLTPKGKNHGLVLLLDRSGSMQRNMAGSIEQILVLAMFCRKVNIPFLVYGFGNETDARAIDMNIPTDSTESLYHFRDKKSFELKDNDLYFHDVYLREYLNNKMSNAEFSEAVRNLIILKKSYEESGRYIGRPQSENLSNTPLTEAIYATGIIMKEFKKKNNLDLTSLIIVHDGDSDNTNYYSVTVFDRYANKNIKSKHMFNTNKQNVTIRDIKNKFEYVVPNSKEYDPSLLAALNWFKQTTDSKIFGFYISGDSSYSLRNALRQKYVNKDGKMFERYNNGVDKIFVDGLCKKFREEKYLVSYNAGYDSFFFIAGGNSLKTEDEHIEIEGKVTSTKLKNAFMKMNKRRVINRVLVSRFIQGIAA